MFSMSTSGDTLPPERSVADGAP
jgi:hypothetical protein